MKLKWLTLIVLGIGIISGLFYWYQWRPSKTRAYCAKNTLTFLQGDRENNEALRATGRMRYDLCLHKYGLLE